MFAMAHDISDRKLAEESLRDSEAALKKAQQVAHVGSWTWHIQQNRLVWSDEMYRIFGIEKENFSANLADVMTRAIHPDDRAAVEESNRSVIEDKKPVPMEYRIIWPDGTVRVVWAEAGEFILNNEGNPDVLTGIVQDITNRKLADASLRESEERFSLAINGIGAGLWDWDMITDQVVYSERWKKMLGYEIDEVEDTFWGWKVLWHPDDCARIEKAIADYLAGKTDHFEITYRCRHKDGGWRWILTRGDIQKDLQKKPVRWVGTNIDISERKQAEDKIKRSEELLNEAQRISKTSSWEYNLNSFEFVLSNEGYSIYELDEDTPANDLFSAFRRRLHPEDLANLDTTAKNAVEKGVGYSYELRAIFDDGRLKNIAGLGEPVKDMNGKVISYRGMFQDITERKQAGDKLNEQMDELRRWHTAMIGREQRTIELKNEVNELLVQAG